MRDFIFAHNVHYAHSPADGWNEQNPRKLLCPHGAATIRAKWAINFCYAPTHKTIYIYQARPGYVLYICRLSSFGNSRIGVLSNSALEFWRFMHHMPSVWYTRWFKVCENDKIISFQPFTSHLTIYLVFSV